ncbi:maltase-glucoamylase, intestinal [Eurytemora carolleeae]|uniref:maltase-glucoamylase, intestinal n=1 Tax=Eurytemora carolleeae TaxID=1294199 RepID=UPI000C78E5DF|nr:maltase-glucoamylase, intestinal [Eurytemora carolleeae]|eukprot:XP_023345565.1 maltase-glucoamylase, intestinal-like [Eurytemora affinis]
MVWEGAKCFLFVPLFILVTGENCHFSNNISIVEPLTEEGALSVAERIDCHPEPDVSREKCESRGCFYEIVEEEGGAPWCYYPTGYGYMMLDEPAETHDGYMVHLRRSVSLPMFGGESQDLWVQVFFQTDNRLRILITDDKPRFQVPIEIPSLGGMPSNPEYTVSFTSSPTFGIRVNRRSSGELVLDTSLPGLVFSDQFIQLPIRLPTGSNLYGWGENEQLSFSHDMNWNTFGLYGRDQPPSGATNMYGVHPRLTILDKNGDTAGLLFLNSAAQEISLTPMPGAIYRTIGGLLDVYIFLGPSPESVVQQYTGAIGRTPIPPYWSLGFHLCRYGYDSLENMQAARDRMVMYKIPQDAQWGDIDIMERQLDFTIDAERFGGLAEYVRVIKEEGVRFVTILDPCISIGEPNCTYKPYDLGEQFGVWINKPNGEPLIGRVWPNDPVYFPDYTNLRTHEWWQILIKEFHDLIDFDGLWIDMNEPANFVAGDLNEGCAATATNYPPYLPHVRIDDAKNGLADKTICGDAVHATGDHYDLHNMFGWFQSKPTLNGVREATGKRGLVLSRSTFVGSGRWVAHWLGDNFSNWSNLRASVIGMLQFNQFGIPFVGADICGFIDDTTPELCSRWQQLGAFYPFSRNHNGLGNIEQDPGFFGEEIALITRDALNIRYNLLPYLYTLFYSHYTQGSTVARALWHEFPQDNLTRTIDDQFMWGSQLLISPVLTQGATSRNIYLPPGSRWFSASNFLDWTSWKEVDSGWVEVDAPLDVLPLHVRGGYAIPLQVPAVNTALSRSNPFQLVFALDNNGRNGEARGELFFDDGDTIDTVESGEYLLTSFMYNKDDEIEYIVHNDGWSGANLLFIEQILVVGCPDGVSSITVNGDLHSDYINTDGQLIISNLKLQLNQPWIIQLE